MTPVAELKAAAQAAVDAVTDQLVALSEQLHGNVETSLEEADACRRLCDLLEAHGFWVERGLGSLPTAFRATTGRGDGPTIAFLAEYDGLPTYGHSCGHNVCAAAAVGAGIGAKAVVDELGGTVVVLGTPGEEGPNGKWTMRDEGFFAGLDAMMLIYPGMDDIPDSRVLTPALGRIQFFGRAAHAAARPELGVNALDAMLIAFNAVNALRQQLPADTRVHGIITKGGTLPMVVPDHTEATFLVRANTPERVEAILPRVQACFDAAALATGCRVEQTWSATVERALLSNNTLAAVYGENLPAVGRTSSPRDELSGAWSADTSAVSWLVPTIEPQVAMTGRGIPPHSHEFHEASVGPQAEKALHDAAVTMALTAVDLLCSPALLESVKQEHAASVAAAGGTTAEAIRRR